MKRPLATVAAGMLALGSIVCLRYSIRTYLLVESSLSDQLAQASKPLMATSSVSATNVVGMEDEELVVGVVCGGQPKAYPIRYLALTEHVNDRIDGQLVCASW